MVHPAPLDAPTSNGSEAFELAGVSRHLGRRYLAAAEGAQASALARLSTDPVPGTPGSHARNHNVGDASQGAPAPGNSVRSAREFSVVAHAQGAGHRISRTLPFLSWLGTTICAGDLSMPSSIRPAQDLCRCSQVAHGVSLHGSWTSAGVCRLVPGMGMATNSSLGRAGAADERETTPDAGRRWKVSSQVRAFSGTHPVGIAHA